MSRARQRSRVRDGVRRACATLALSLSLVSFGAGADDAPAGRLRGEVRDAALRPLAGALVVATRREAPAVLVLTAADERGAIAFDDLPAGVYDVRALAPGLATARVDGVDVGGPYRAVVDLVAAKGEPDVPRAAVAASEGASTVTVRVVDRQGAGMAGTLVTMVPLDHRADPVATRTDARGEARLEPRSPGRWTFTVARAGYTTLWVTEIDWPRGPLRVFARLLEASPATATPLFDLLPKPELLEFEEDR